MGVIIYAQILMVLQLNQNAIITTLHQFQL